MSPRAQSPFTFEYVLLGLLEQQPSHGYDLHKAITQMEGVSLVWSVKQARLYALLDKLESLGWVSAEIISGNTRPDRKEYRLTEEGRRQFHLWLGSPVRRGRQIRQEFIARLYFARRQGERAVRNLIQAQREECRRWLLDVRLQREVSPGGPMDEVVYDFRQAQAESILAWLDTCERRLLA
ncbi:MAG TPA: PadR family transcriptional regulator [Chloroflexi bacterium]|jgi:DNA-binding PadR family transcriptional regulator|nr:PadR family transcriptional regulator [Chloroflexota bacterium]